MGRRSALAVAAQSESPGQGEEKRVEQLHIVDPQRELLLAVRVGREYPRSEKAFTVHLCLVCLSVEQVEEVVGHRHRRVDADNPVVEVSAKHDGELLVLYGNAVYRKLDRLRSVGAHHADGVRLAVAVGRVEQSVQLVPHKHDLVPEATLPLSCWRLVVECPLLQDCPTGIG